MFKVISTTVVVFMILSTVLINVEWANAAAWNQKDNTHTHQLRNKFGDDGITNWDFIKPVTHLAEVPDGYVGINTPEDLDNMRNDLEAHYILMNNIDLSEWENWEPIGVGMTGTLVSETGYLEDPVPFEGNFNGNGYVVSNMTININIDSGCAYVGLFGAVKNSIIENVGIVNVDITTSGYRLVTGALVGDSYGSTTIVNSYASGIIKQTASISFLGGIAGRSTTIKECYNTSCITVVNREESGASVHLATGGIVDSVVDAIDCYNNGEIMVELTGHTSSFIVSVSGIAAHPGGSVINCVNSGNLTTAIVDITLEGMYNHSLIDVGGIAGNSLSAIIERCSNTGDISASISNLHSDSASTDFNSFEVTVGGIAGLLEHASILECANFGMVTATALNNDVSNTYVIAGGLAGWLEANDSSTSNMSMLRSYNQGEIVAEALSLSNNQSYAYAGGLSGYTFYSLSKECSLASIVNCYNRGSITAKASTMAVAGGIMSSFTGGISTQTNYTYIENCYSTGVVNAISDVQVAGAIAGIIRWSHSPDLPNGKYLVLKDCYYPDTAQFGIERFEGDGAELNNVIALTDSQMHKQSSYIGFDFDYVWNINPEINFGYPYLRDYIPLTSISFDNTEIKINKDEKQTLTITYNPINTTDRVATWYTSDPNIATVTDGAVTAHNLGTVTITARVGKYEATCEVTVLNPLISISLDKSEITLCKDEQAPLSVIYNPTDTTDDTTVIWSTSNTDVATVENGVVTAHTIGTAIITATAGGLEATCTITVLDSSPLGDANRDGKVNAGDAACILQWLVKLRTDDEIALEYSDFNGDSEVSSGDAAAILQSLIGLWPQG